MYWYGANLSTPNEATIVMLDLGIGVFQSVISSKNRLKKIFASEREVARALLSGRLKSRFKDPDHGKGLKLLVDEVVKSGTYKENFVSCKLISNATLLDFKPKDCYDSIVAFDYPFQGTLFEIKIKKNV